MLHQLEAVHHRHAQIGQQHIEALSEKIIQTLFAIPQ